jgi:AraC-like DNA-binding protein
MVVLGIFPERKLKLIDSLHLLPFFIHTAELIPFYAQTAEQKIAFISNLYKSNVNPWLFKDGLFLSYRDHILIKFSIMSAYVTLLWVYIFQYKKSVSKDFNSKNKYLVSFLTYEVFNKTVLIALNTSITIFYINNLSVLLQLPSILLMIDILASITIVLLFPSLLLGVKPVMVNFSIAEEDGSEAAPPTPNTSSQDEKHLPTPKQEQHFELIETMMQRNQPFLNPDFSRDKLSQLIGLSKQNITDALSTNARLSFNDYVNTYRINFLIELVKTDKKWLDYTIEALALKAGFANRVTFSNSIKRIRGVLPKELIEELRKL